MPLCRVSVVFRFSSRMAPHHSQANSRTRRSRGIPLALAFLALLLPLVICFAKPLAGIEVLFFRDAGHYYFPLFEWIDSEWRQGRIPLWTPQENSGLPVLADATSSVFYPIKLLFFLPLPYAVRYNWYVLIHLVLAAVTLWTTARRWGLDRPAATLASVAYAFGGPVLFLYSNIVFLVGAAWLPLGIRFAFETIELRSYGAATRLGIVMAMCVLGGDPQTAYHLLLAALLFVSIRQVGLHAQLPPPHPAETSVVPNGSRSKTNPSGWFRATYFVSACSQLRRFDRVCLLAYAACVGIGLAAVQIAPSSEWTRESERVLYDAPRSIWEALAEYGRHSQTRPDTLTAVDTPEKTHTPSDLPLADTQSASRTWDGIFGNPTAGTHHANIYRYSFAPWHILECVWPHVSGRMFPTNQRWMRSIPAEGLDWTPTIYLGLIPVLLAAKTWSLRSTDPQIRRLSWLSLLALLGAFGIYAPGWIARELLPRSGSSEVGNAVGGIYWMMVTFLPGYAYFRYPAKLLVPFAFSLSLLAGYGMQRSESHASAISRWLGRILIVSIALAILLFAFHTRFATWVTANSPPDDWLGPVDGARVARDLQGSFLHAAITAFLAMGLLRLRCSTEVRSWLLLGLTTVELTIVSASLVATAPADPLTQTPALASLVSAQTSESDARNPFTGMFRLYRSTDWLPKAWLNEASPDRLERSFSWDHETLFPRHPLRWHLSYLSGTSSLVPADLKLVLDAGRIASDRDGLEFAPPLLSLLSAGTLILPPDASPSDWSPIVPVKPGTEEQVSIWQNPRALPRVRIVREIVQLPPLEDRSLRARKKRTEIVLFDHGVWRDFQSIAVIEASEPILKPIEPTRDENSIDASNASFANTLGTVADRVAIRHEDPQRIVIEAVLPTAGLLVLGDLAAPGWIATVESTDSSDRSPRITPILRTNRVQRGVWLERGSHRVTFQYQPSAFYRGALVSLCAWGVLLIVVGRAGLHAVRRLLGG